MGNSPQSVVDASFLTFTTTDARGNEHEWHGTYHPAQEGYLLSIQLIQTLGPALLASLGDLTDLLTDAVEEGSMSDELKDRFNLDFSAALDALAEVDSAKVAKITYKALKYVSRDSVKMIGPSGKPTHDFNKAFRGNYGELFFAFWEVVQGNKFIPLLGMSSLEDEDEDGETTPVTGIDA